jgi:hypothetical protein
MKDHKPISPGGANVNPAVPGATDEANGRREASSPTPLRVAPGSQETPKPSASMHTVNQTRKYRGRLGRDVQAKLGKTLQAYFDDVVKEGVPDRFKDLLKQFDERKDKESG